MKTMFVHAKLDHDVTLSKEALKALKGKKVGLVSNVQHLHKLPEVKKQLPGSVFLGQVLGCRAENAEAKQDKVDCFLYMGTGQFHPIKVAMVTNKPVFIFSPLTKEFRELDYDFVKKYEEQTQGALNRFFHAKNVGILISTKVGQSMGKINRASVDLKMQPVEYLKKRKDDKKYYVFAFDTLSHQELENFNFIDCWINTACSRIRDDENVKVVNIEDIMRYDQRNSKVKD
ncbi:MAG: diphthamide synthesis protein [Candidatus Woesearchaeota archaeon]|jgi:2-(3-amino-3-carboxypropyl)histidine synthase|nr:diphthamide synthesis protein [Candidatus Woesearchaeota archaeon]MDP7199046.1 diphthamide synthesis protein [Candidatus Woesearchaeota archaeon]MDP7467756.1 diphthamide synthesis protein [Candidatus Woesearchaeota archaeon]MDP7646459.1 diphthamide synthesis protein [Candidatus Woesearchaeota archaeon]